MIAAGPLADFELVEQVVGRGLVKAVPEDVHDSGLELCEVSSPPRKATPWRSARPRCRGPRGSSSSGPRPSPRADVLSTKNGARYTGAVVFQGLMRRRNPSIGNLARLDGKTLPVPLKSASGALRPPWGRTCVYCTHGKLLHDAQEALYFLGYKPPERYHNSCIT